MEQQIVFVKKIIFEILLHLFVKILDVLKSSTDDLIITCDEMIDVSDAMSINLNDKKATCK